MEFNIKANSTAEVSEKCTENNTAIKLGSGQISGLCHTGPGSPHGKRKPSTPATLSSRKAITPSALP